MVGISGDPDLGFPGDVREERLHGATGFEGSDKNQAGLFNFGVRVKSEPTARKILQNQEPTLYASGTMGRNPVGVGYRGQCLPRVAPGSQPWAGGRNPVGIRKRSCQWLKLSQKPLKTGGNPAFVISEFGLKASRQPGRYCKRGVRQNSSISRSPGIAWIRHFPAPRPGRDGSGLGTGGGGELPPAHRAMADRCPRLISGAPPGQGSGEGRNLSHTHGKIKNRPLAGRWLAEVFHGGLLLFHQ